MTENRKERILAEINARVPAGVDWKQGAKDYLSNLIRDQGAHNEAYHLIKPFIGGDDFRPFLDEMYSFLNIMSLSSLTGQSRVLDVGCGPGWISHYLGKFGIRVVGIDISQELLDIAARRLAADPYPAMGEFRVKFLLHDIESHPLRHEEPFDLAILESVLHHFLDPVSALEHVAKCLKDDGLVVIAEGAAPAPGSSADLHYRFLMDKFHTLERPYTREQLVEMLDIAGFSHHAFFETVSGWVPQTGDRAARAFHHLRDGRGNNFVVASRSAARMQGIVGASQGPALPVPALAAARPVSHYLGLPTATFVAEAYRAVLGREPDAAGAAHYGRAIDEGRLARVEVLARLAYSAEGRRSGKAPPGLAAAFAFSCACRIPVVGAIVERAARALGLSPRLRDPRRP